jgi:hypothetical protein
MRARLWAGLVGLCLAWGLFGVEPGRGQSGAGMFPVGRPFTFASGFSGPVQNVPIDTTNVVAPLPQNNTGMIMPNFRRLMGGFPNRNIVHGESAIPAPKAFPGASFFQNLNPFGGGTK